MKKLLFISLSAILLSACADKEQYQQAVLEDMQGEQDLKDYKIDPQHMTECVVDLTSKKMPGLFPLDPYRLTAYRNYAKMVSLTKTEDPKKTLEELRNDFGSPKALIEARSNYTESISNCLSAIIMESEEAEQKKDKDNKS